MWLREAKRKVTLRGVGSPHLPNRSRGKRNHKDKAPNWATAVGRTEQNVATAFPCELFAPLHTKKGWVEKRGLLGTTGVSVSVNFRPKSSRIHVPQGYLWWARQSVHSDTETKAQKAELQPKPPFYAPCALLLYSAPLIFPCSSIPPGNPVSCLHRRFTCANHTFHS